MPDIVSPPVAATRTLRDLPSPPGLPLLGQTFAVDLPRMHQQLEGWQRELGGLYRLDLGGREFLVVGDAELAAAALRGRPANLGRTERFMKVASTMGFLGLFASNGEDWRRQRPMVMAALDPGHIKTFFPSLATVTGRFAMRWQRAADAGATIELQPDLMRFTVDAISSLAFGADINTIESEGHVIQQHLDQILPAVFRRVFSPLQTWRWLKTPDERRVNHAIEQVGIAVHGFIAQARERMAQDPSLREKPRNLLEAMLAARDQPGSSVTDADVAGNVLTMLLAGEDTTANTLAWMIWLLWRHPEALARARDEVRSVLHGDAWPSSLDQVARLDFVEACAHETMRLRPVAPILPQQAHQDLVIGDVAVPAGTLVIFLMRVGAVDERHFPDAQRFDPERWLSGNADAHSTKRIAMPFGAGARLCPGRYLALVEIKLVMAMLLASFDIEAVDTPGGGDPVERLALTMSAVGLTLRLRRRAA